MDDDEAAVHDKLMQGCDRSTTEDDDGSGPTSTKRPANKANSAAMSTTIPTTGGGSVVVSTNDKKSPSSYDFKVDGPIPKSGSFTDRRRHELRARRRGVLCVVVCLLVLITIGVVTFLLMHYLPVKDVVMVWTSVGKIRGRVVPSPQGGSTVAEFLGIPFAHPPIGDLRYADPVELDKLPEDPYEADSVRNACMQPIDTTFGDFPGSDMWNAKNPRSEDCLYLNIWVPHSTSVAPSGDGTKSSNDGTKSAGKAVMVWIYGGGFFSGSNSLWVYDGKALASFGDVIVASFNYRVGTFGYLSTGDGRIKGNFGMKDQVVALRWIRNNIASFGGDPGNVTLFGESSGASSAGLHQMSSWSRDLFARAIYQSGSPDSQWSFMTRAMARRRSAMFFDAVNCTQSSTTSKLLQCLRQLDAETILSTEWVQGDFMVFPWAPTVDGDFLTDTPYNMLKSGKFQHKDALLGVNRDEGTYWILYALPGFSKDNDSLQTLPMYQKGVQQIAWDLTPDQQQRIYERYLVSDGQLPDANRDALDKVCGDRSFTCPTKELAHIYSRHGIKTYFYYLVHRASNEVWPPWMGVIHGADVQWTFGMPLNSSRAYSREEIDFAKIIMKYWTNFAKTGNPNTDESSRNSQTTRTTGDKQPPVQIPTWPEYTYNNPQYLELRGPDDFAVTTSFRDSYCHVWREINRQIQTAANEEDSRLS